MNNTFTETLGHWLETPHESRNYRLGAELLFRLNHNVIMFRNLSANPERKAEFIAYQLQKYYNTRVADYTHEEVVRMKAQVEVIAQKAGLASETPKPKEKELKNGKRADHDSLPDNIRQLYVDNLDILHRMRDVHAKLRLMSEKTDGTVCPDSDLYPYLKELIALDKKYRANWNTYDTYDTASGESVAALHSREQSKRALRLVNLNKGRYAKNPSKVLAEKIRAWYKEIIDPSDSLKKELSDLGLL